ncbi:MAG: hypothetical protein KC583_10920, partial [Myxococcales bacterium]|nr:hypothetical protein [Myxococcales bacterium]
MRARVLLMLVLAVGCDEGGEAGPVVDAAIDAAPDDVGSTPDRAVDAAVDMAPEVEPDMAPDAAPPVEWPAVAADNAVDPDDPLAEGQARMVYETWGAELKPGWPPAAFLLDLMRAEPDVFGDQFAAWGFVQNPDSDLPFGLARGSKDPERVHHTCAACHIARLDDGRVWLGAPNTRLDFEGFRVAVHARWVAAGNPAYLEPLEAEKMQAMGPGRTNAESADYPRPVPADFPPYYRLETRGHLNYLGTGRDVRTEVHLALYSFGPGNPDDETAVAGPFPDAAVVDALIGFMGQIDGPENPAPPDPAAVARGAEVFAEARCDACHHPAMPEMDGVTPIDTADDGRDRLPGEDPEWPDGSIHTSPLHRVLIDGDEEGGGGVDEGRLQLILFIARHGLRVGATDGYRVPTLEGLWSTPPYLHNGSVPTLDALLDAPADRPAVFEVHGVERDVALTGNS